MHFDWHGKVVHLNLSFIIVVITIVHLRFPIIVIVTIDRSLVVRLLSFSLWACSQLQHDAHSRDSLGHASFVEKMPPDLASPVSMEPPEQSAREEITDILVTRTIRTKETWAQSTYRLSIRDFFVRQTPMIDS